MDATHVVAEYKKANETFKEIKFFSIVNFSESFIPFLTVFKYLG